MADITDLVNLSTEELSALRDALQADLDAARSQAGPEDPPSVAPAPTVREGQDTAEFQKSEVAPSTRLKGGAAIPTHGEDGHALSLEDKWALLWPSRSAS